MGIRPFLLSILLAPLMVLVLSLEASAAQVAPATPTLDPLILRQLPAQPVQPRPDLNLRTRRSLVLSASSTRIQSGGSVDFNAVIQPGINTNALYYYSVGGRIEPKAPHGSRYRKYFPSPGQYTVSVKANLGPDNDELYSNQLTVTVDPKPRIQYSLVLKVDKQRIYTGDSVRLEARLQPGSRTQANYSFLVDGRNDVSNTPRNIYRKRFDRAGNYTLTATAFLGPDSGNVRSNAVRVIVEDRPPPIQYSLRLSADKQRASVGDSVTFEAAIQPGGRTQASYSFLVNGRPELSNIRQNVYRKRFDRAGTYTVTATAVPGSANSAVSSNSVKVVIDRPIQYSLSLTADPQQIFVGESSRLEATLRPDSPTSPTYTFLIDGRPDLSNTRQSSYRKRFDQAGTYSVRASAYRSPDAAYLNSNTTIVVVKDRPAPIRQSLSLSADRTRVRAGDTVELTASMTPPVRDSLRYTFRIDGRDEPGAPHGEAYLKRFDRPGRYSASVTTPDPNRRSILSSNRLVIQVDPQPARPSGMLQAIIDPPTITVPWGESVRFRSVSRIPAGARPSYQWDGPDDVHGNDAVFEIDTGRHAPREYPITLTVSVPGERPAQATGRLFVTAPRLALTADRSEADPGEAIRFDLTVPSATTDQQYVLYFGDDNAEPLPGSGRIEYAYAAEGVYEVLATAWIHGQAVESNRLQIRVPRSAPVFPPSPPVIVPPEPTSMSPWVWILPLVSVVAGVALYRFTRPTVAIASTIKVVAVPDAQPAVDLSRRDTNGTRIDLILVGDTGEQHWEMETASEEPRNG